MNGPAIECVVQIAIAVQQELHISGDLYVVLAESSAQGTALGTVPKTSFPADQCRQ